MRIDPEIAAMRRDPSRQRRVQAAMIAAARGWHAAPQMAAIDADLARFAGGVPLEACPALAALFAPGDAGGAFCAELCRWMSEMLAREPWGQPALRHGFDGTTATLLLARVGRAHLILQTREPGSWDYDSAAFSDSIRYETVLAGSAEAKRVRLCGKAPPTREPFALDPGTRLALDLSDEALQIERVERRLVSLRLQRFAAQPRPTREYALDSGTLCQQAAGDMRTSRQEMALALLGRMGRAEAAPEMAALACEPGDPSLRWQALRECLALDSKTGFATLCAVAREADDTLAAPAGALRAQLIEAHPELRQLEDQVCPA